MALKLTPDSVLFEQIRSGDIKSCYYFYGKDVATLESVVKKLEAKLLIPEQRDLNYHFFDGANLDMSALSDAAEALPMFADRVVIAINDYYLKSDQKSAEPKKGAKRQDPLKTILSELDPETTTVIFYATGVDPCDGKKTLNPKNSSLAEHICSCGGEVCEFAYKKPRELVKYICRRVEKNGSSISQDAALKLAESCLSNLLMIQSETDKLSAYRFGEEISADDVSELVAGQMDTDIYKLARAATSGDRRSVFVILSELYNRGIESGYLLSAIGGAFLDLYRAKLALMTGRSEQDVVADYNYGSRAFVVRNSLRDCQRIPVSRLRYCLSVISDCDIAMKSSRTDRRILLETAIVMILSGEGAR